MEKTIKMKLLELIKESRHLTSSWYYVQDDIYKQIDEIYESHQKEVVDILYTMTLDTIEDPFDNNTYRAILYYLLLEHKYSKDDVRYLKASYKKMILKIFTNDKYTRLREFDNLTAVGFTKMESENLFRKYIKSETDPAVIKKYKYEILLLESDRLFPNRRFTQTICILELHQPGKDKINTLQDNINNRIKDYGIDIVREWIKVFLNHEYLSEGANDMLRQVKISDVVW